MPPVSTCPGDQRHCEWTDHDQPLTAGKVRQSKSTATTLHHARKDTQQLILHSTDPGLAFEHLAISKPGPYTLEFRLQSQATGPAELFWTTDPETILPKGKHLDFEVNHDGEWHEIKLIIDEAKTLHGLRLDPCGGEGEVKIEGLTLKAADEKVLAKWP